MVGTVGGIEDIGNTAIKELTDEELANSPTVFRDDLFKDNVILVSGGGSGLGKAMAYLFARLGADVMICGRSQAKLEATAAGIREQIGAEIGFKSMTIRDPEEVDALMNETWERFGNVNLLVNNAGGQFAQAAIDFTIKGWNAVIDTNLNGTWYMMQAAAQKWRDKRSPGSIVNIVANVQRGMPTVAHTCAARAGVIYLSKTLSTEWAPLKIRVNCVSPGAIETPGLNAYQPGVIRNFSNSNPMRRIGDAYDVAEAVAYLAAPSGKFITGEVLVVDGGQQQWGEFWSAGVPDYFKINYD